MERTTAMLLLAGAMLTLTTLATFYGSAASTAAAPAAAAATGHQGIVCPALDRPASDATRMSLIVPAGLDRMGLGFAGALFRNK